MVALGVPKKRSWADPETDTDDVLVRIVPSSLRELHIVMASEPLGPHRVVLPYVHYAV